MKKYFLVICILALCLPLQAQGTLKHKVVLKNGTILRGNLVTNDDPDIITIKTADRSLYSYAITEVQEINNTKWSERWRFPYNRPLGVFLRPELGIGIGCSASLSLGLQIGPYYALYGGVATNLVSIGLDPFEQNYNQYYNWNCIFVANRLYFSPKRTSYYLDFRFGTGWNRLEQLRFDELNPQTYMYLFQPNIQKGKYYSLGIGYSPDPTEIGLYCLLLSGRNYNYVLWPYNGKFVSIYFTFAYNLRRNL